MNREPEKPDRQGDREPIVEDAGLPYMKGDDEGVRELMASVDSLKETGQATDVPPALAVKPDRGPTERMAAFRPEDEEKEAPVGKGEQKRSPTGSNGARSAEEGYVRLRVRLEGDDLKVVGAHSVEGPLAFDDTLQGDLVYEVRDQGRRIGIGTIPDATEWRSFPPPEPEGEMVGHHVTPLQSVEFNVRVPRKELSPESLERISIDVYDLKEVPDRRYLSPEPLAEQVGREARLVTRLEGLGLESQRLEPRVVDELRRAVRPPR